MHTTPSPRHLYLLPIGQNLVTWPHIGIREAGKSIYSKWIYIYLKITGSVTKEYGKKDYGGQLAASAN